MSPMSDLAPKCVRLAPNRKNSGLFQIRFKYILDRRVKIYWNMIGKIPDLSKFGANLTHFSAKPDIHATCLALAMRLDEYGRKVGIGQHVTDV